MKQNEVKYVVTKDPAIVERFLKAAPTKYLVGIYKRSLDPGYFDFREVWHAHTIKAKWSFGKDENYEIRFNGKEVIAAELAKRENIKGSKKHDRRVITCNCCGNKMDFTGANKEYAVFVGNNNCNQYGMRRRAAYWGLKPFDYGKKRVVEFKCTKCHENIIVEV